MIQNRLLRFSTSVLATVCSLAFFQGCSNSSKNSNPGSSTNAGTAVSAQQPQPPQSQGLASSDAVQLSEQELGQPITDVVKIRITADLNLARIGQETSDMFTEAFPLVLTARNVFNTVSHRIPDSDEDEAIMVSAIDQNTSLHFLGSSNVDETGCQIVTPNPVAHEVDLRNHLTSEHILPAGTILYVTKHSVWPRASISMPRQSGTSFPEVEIFCGTYSNDTQVPLIDINQPLLARDISELSGGLLETVEVVPASNSSTTILESLRASAESTSPLLVPFKE